MGDVARSATVLFREEASRSFRGRVLPAIPTTFSSDQPDRTTDTPPIRRTPPILHHSSGLRTAPGTAGLDSGLDPAARALEELSRQGGWGHGRDSAGRIHYELHHVLFTLAGKKLPALKGTPDPARRSLAASEGQDRLRQWAAAGLTIGWTIDWPAPGSKTLEARPTRYQPSRRLRADRSVL